jgi:uncharacterized membrane protein SirB2
MTDQIDLTTDGRTQAGPAARDGINRGSWFRRELALAVSFLGLGVMVLALLLPHELRIFAFYPALGVIAVGVVLTLLHGPDRPRID